MPLTGLSEATQKLVSYWQTLPKVGDLQVPERRVFQSGPVVAPYLSELFLTEWMSEKEIIIRLSGTKLERIIGREVTDQNLFDLIPEKLHENEAQYYEHLRTTGCAGMLTRAIPNLKSFPIVYRTVHFPLADQNGVLKYWIGTGTKLSEEQTRQEYPEADYNTVDDLGRDFFYSSMD